MARIDTIESRPDSTAINLSRILTRLERTVLLPESDQGLKSSYERTKVGAVRIKISNLSGYPRTGNGMLGLDKLGLGSREF
jgi:hypothetical protein